MEVKQFNMNRIKELLDIKDNILLKKYTAALTQLIENGIYISNIAKNKISGLMKETKQLETKNAELKKTIKYKMDDYKLHIEGVYVEKYADVNKELKAKLLSCESELAEKDKYILKLKKEIAKYYNEKI